MHKRNAAETLSHKIEANTMKWRTHAKHIAISGKQWLKFVWALNREEPHVHSPEDKATSTELVETEQSW